MISSDMFTGILLLVLVLFSPLIALIERFFLELSVLLIVFILGFAIVSSPILFLAGIVLILASEATVSSGFYYILFSVISPFILIPLFFFFSELVESDFIENPYIVPLTNMFLVVLAFFIFGTSSVYFTIVITLALILIAGDFAMNKITNF